MAKQSQLEQQILQAAETLFLEKGFDSTSTTDIAKCAGCNQALVHYYFRTKENLFQRIFTEKVNLMLTYITPNPEETVDFECALNRFIDCYFEMLTKNPNIPFFLIKELIMSEVRRNWIRKMLMEDAQYLHFYYAWDKMVKAEIKSGRLRQIETMELTLNVISLIAFTFVSLPLYRDFFEQDQLEIDFYLQRRKNEIKRLIINGVRT